MQYVQLNDGNKIPAVGFGVFLIKNDGETYDAVKYAIKVGYRHIVMAGAQTDTLYMTQDCYDKATGSKDKELFLIEGAHHIQTYFVLEYVDKFVTKLVGFYGKNI